MTESEIREIVRDELKTVLMSSREARQRRIREYEELTGMRRDGDGTGILATSPTPPEEGEE